MAHIQIADISPRVSYTVSTATTVFAVPFAFFEASNLVVTVGASTLVLGSDYSVSGTAVDGGFSSGTVTLDTAVTSAVVVIERILPIARTTDFPNSGPLSIPALNTEHDKFVAIMQQLAEGQLTFASDVQAARTLFSTLINADTTVTLFDTLAAFTLANVGAAVTHIRTAGCYTVGDGGASLWKVIATPSPVKLYHRVSANGVYIEYAPEGKLNPRAIGAKGDNTQDEAGYFDDLIAFAAGRNIYAPGGRAGYRFDRPLTPYAGAVNIEGDGNGQATSPGTIYNSIATAFLINFTNGYLFSIDHSSPMTFKGILFRGPAANMTSGGALYFTCSGGGLGCSPIILGCAFALVYRGITINKVSDARIAERNIFNQWVHAAIHLTTGGGFEGGGGVITDNIFIGYISGIYGVYTECGYVKICNNRIVGCSAAFALISTDTSSGAFEVFQNQIEEQTTYGVLVTRAGTGLASMPQIKNNQFSNVNQTGLLAHIAIVDSIGGDWMDTIAITGNIMRSFLGNSSAYIQVASGTDVTCDMNQIHHFGAGTAVGISVKGTALKVPAFVRNNSFYGLAAGTRYDVSTAVVVIDLLGITFAAASAMACADGSMILVTDGTANANPLTGGGTGAIAKRIGGIWRSD